VFALNNFDIGLSQKMEKYKKFADESTGLNPFVPLEHPPSKDLLAKLLYYVSTKARNIKGCWV
jgi:hypothetical protein